MPRYQLVDNVREKKIGSFFCVFLEGSDSIYKLNQMSSFLWSFLKKAKSEEYLVKAVLKEFSAEPDVVKRDVHQFLERQLANGFLIQVSG